MTNAKHIKGLPKLPEHLVAEVHASIKENKGTEFPGIESLKDIYEWIPANDKIQKWCKENISEDVYWAIQVINKDLPKHKDVGTESKFNYIIAGGDAVTHFYDDDGQEIENKILKTNEWYILKTSVSHEVTDVNNIRISITGRITP